MKVHKLVYTKLYFALVKHYVTFDLKGQEGRTKNDRLYKLKSQNIWNVLRKVDGDKYYLVSLITKNTNTSYWIYYRLLTNYDSEPGTNKYVTGDYQEIKGGLISNALKHIKFAIPDNLQSILFNQFAHDNKRKVLDEVEGEILLEQFIRDKYPKLTTYLKYNIYKANADISTISFSREKFNTVFGDNNLRHLPEQGQEFFKLQIEKLARDYLRDVESKNYIGVLNKWCNKAQFRLFFKTPQIFELMYSKFSTYQNIYLSGFDFSIDNFETVKADCTLSFIESTLLPRELSTLKYFEHYVWQVGHREILWTFEVFYQIMGHGLEGPEIEEWINKILKNANYLTHIYLMENGRWSGNVNYVEPNDVVPASKQRLLKLSVKREGDKWLITDLEPAVDDGTYLKKIFQGY